MLLSIAGSVAVTAGPAAAAQGVTVRITELPDRFAAGAAPAAMTVVAAKRGGNCLKVRWSMVLRLAGAGPDRVRVARIEQGGTFPVEVRRTGNAVRFTDQQLDPGTLCRDRTVTARYDIAFADDVSDARATFQAEAYGVDRQLLAQDTATRGIAGAPAAPGGTAPASPPAGGGAAAAPSDPATSATPAPGGDADPPAGAPAGGTGAGAGTLEPGDPAAATRRYGVVRVGPLGLAVGAVMMFLGFGLLLMVRGRLRRRPAGHPGQGMVRPSSGARRPTRASAWRTRTSRSARRPGASRQTLPLPPLRR